MRLFAQQRRVITVPLVAFVLVIVCGCSVTLLAVGYGTGTPPQFALDLGLMQVIGRLSTVPDAHTRHPACSIRLDVIRRSILSG